jgi:hypothetical protein
VVSTIVVIKIVESFKEELAKENEKES